MSTCKCAGVRENVRTGEGEKEKEREGENVHVITAWRIHFNSNNASYIRKRTAS